ncbi:precorrin-6A/cobalt-precorrin-6A reductase [Synechococcus sp. RSCCF101]|uniref:precorrin-6A/cobalt-precorrin-6A reductase n=1 Tax=Synechococcus sp. RSCCF101 TaxID=2511069 RepID=UPI00178577F5|nr:precorrin-6A/cobalt-precorrin-6A reductase [Synechococcus sp. RSCCF101]
MGPLKGAGAVVRELRQARATGDPFSWVIDATHPFATTVRGQLLEACSAEAQPLIRLLRRDGGMAVASGTESAAPMLRLKQMQDLVEVDLRRRRLLLAIGSRHLAALVPLLPGAVLHARVLPEPRAIRLALAAGIRAGRLACLRPGPLATGGLPGAVEAGLCRRWGIEAVLFRASGGANEESWHRIARAGGLTRLILEAPAAPPVPRGLTHHRLTAPALLQWLGRPGDR